ncbi:flagellar protein FlaG [Paenibacillus illinoisensis]|uniref:flagellar protein FlaG n=1 Tax=Paenibacillus illinoisensis TaxID=59845 RepID=UPI000FDAACA7|nr:flagellar protein FlaG [Paenibacillus illinoisensis]
MDTKLSTQSSLNSILSTGHSSALSTGSSSDLKENQKIRTPTTGNAPMDQEKIIADLQKAIRAIQGPQKAFEISMHEQTHTIMIKVLDKESGDLIREVPPEKILDLAARMMEITGLIIDEKI